MAESAEQILVMSLDGATSAVLDPLMKLGYMTNLRDLRARGVAANLASVIPPVTPPAWTSFMTGKHPGKHGIFGFLQFDANHYKWVLNNSRRTRSKTIWQILSEHGKRVAVLNLPQTYPPYEVNGVMVSGWESASADFTYPGSLGHEILRKFPQYDSNLWRADLMSVKSDNDVSQFLDKLIRGIGQTTDLALHLLRSEPWDVFMVHFHQTDWIQHKLWREIEEACASPAKPTSRHQKIREVYTRLDESLGTLLRELPSERALKIILSDHGFGCHRGTIFPNYHLKSWGYLRPAMPTQEDRLKPVKDFFRKSRRASLRKLYKSVANLRHMFDASPSPEEYEQYDSWQDFAEQGIAQPKVAIDWLNTQVATVDAYASAFLYVNVIGRGPQGIVEPGRQYESLVGDVISRFREIRHPLTGEKLLARVERGADVYTGAPAGVFLPDIVLTPADGYDVAFSLSDAAPEPTSSGIHRPSGVLFMEGAGVEPSVNEFRPGIVDLAPTLFHWLGLSVPTDMDGRVLKEILRLDSPARYEEVDNTTVQQEHAEYSAGEARLIEQRLKGLGYIE